MANPSEGVTIIPSKIEGTLEDICNGSRAIIEMCGAAIAQNSSNPEILTAITALAQKHGYLADSLIRMSGSPGCIGEFDAWLKIGRRV